ncbi:hypothetical protein [Rhizobium sp. LjRoot254]|uniref:hypothetical protein n=1 Tax=Rhizobium sp. LjRoot254 TaxID=3342297 RepID=UPI003ECE6713
MSNEIIYRRLAELLDQSVDLAKAADGQILVYLFEMAKVELQSLRNGNDNGDNDSFVTIKHQR